MKYIFITIFHFLFSIQSFAQSESGEIISSDVENYMVDRIGNVFFFDSKNVVSKYEPNIKRFTRYADLRSGKISSIDVSNPLRVIVFYSDQGVVKFLDVNLTEINSFQIRNTYPDGWISLVAASNNNGLWMYDNLNRKLIKLGEQLNSLFQSSDLFLVLSKKINPTYMIEYGDELFLCDKEQGIFVFDLFGGYKKTLPIKPDDFIQFDMNSIFYNNQNYLLRYSQLKTDTIKVFEQSYRRSTISNSGYYILKNTDLYFFKE